jgi:hypothetical protein
MKFSSETLVTMSESTGRHNPKEHTQYAIVFCRHFEDLEHHLGKIVCKRTAALVNSSIERNCTPSPDPPKKVHNSSANPQKIKSAFCCATSSLSPGLVPSEINSNHVLIHRSFNISFNAVIPSTCTYPMRSVPLIS